MIKQAVHQLWITSGIALCCLTATIPARAQIVPDVTLGPKKSTVKSNVRININDLRGDRIDGGAIRGTNLFHSFEEFNIEKGQRVYFTNPDGIENIFSRVTGGSHSKILGTLSVLGNANLFLLNPNGILFGHKARLNIRGSFLASTANSLKFKDGKQFSTVAPQTTPLLTMSTPVGLQFGGTAGKIINRSQAPSLSGKPSLEIEGFKHPVGLQVRNGYTLALVGGDVALEGGNLTAKGGRIELGSVAGVGEVSLKQNKTGNLWRLGYDSIDAFGDIRLEHGALVNTSGEGGGGVQVQGRRITLIDRSWIEASTLGAEPGGELRVTASESVQLIGGTLEDRSFRLKDRNFRRGLFARVEKNATNKGGTITVDTGRLVIDGARITTATVAKNSRGDSGNIIIKARQLLVRNGGQVVTSTIGAEGEVGAGDGGDLTVKDSDWVKLTGLSEVRHSALLAQVGVNSTGYGGDIHIETEKLVIEKGARVSAEVSIDKEDAGAKLGGNLTVTATESVEVSGNESRLSTEVDQDDTDTGSSQTEAGSSQTKAGRLCRKNW